MIYLDFYGIKAKINCNKKSLEDFIKSYYQIFLVEKLKDFDIEIDLTKLSYFSLKNKNSFFNIEGFTTIGDGIKVDLKNKKYFFSTYEIQGFLDFSNEKKILVKGILKPLFVRHWVNILLQGFSRIEKYYNRFITKSLVHDILFILFEKKYGSSILHATSVTNGKNTFVFTGLGGAGKSTLAAAFASQKGYKILSDNYCFIKGDKLFPFPELPRITSNTSDLIGAKKGKKADGIKTYLKNDLTGIEKEYKIDKIFISSYGKDFSIEKLNDSIFIFEVLNSINSYTGEFPEHQHLSLLSIIGKFNSGKNRNKNLELISEKNNFYLVKNSKDLKNNLDEIEKI